MPKALPYAGTYFYYKPKRDRYVIQFKRRGRRGSKQITLKAQTEALAYAEAVEWGRKYEAGLFDPFQDRVEVLTLVESVKRYLAHSTALAEGTLRERRITLERFANGLPQTLEARDVTAKHVAAFAGNRSLKASTQQGYYAKLRSCFNWLRAEGYIRENPCDGVAEPKASRKAPVYLSKAEAKKLIGAAETDALVGKAPEWMPDLVRVGIGTGFRRAELCALRWRDVDLVDGRVYTRSYIRKDAAGEVLYSFTTKSGHDRAVPLLPLAREALERLHAARANEDEDEAVFQGGRSGGPLHGNFVGEEFREQRKRAGLPKRFTFHTLRHTFASWLVTQGVPLRHVQAYLGHASIRTTEVYAHLVEDRAHEVAAAAMAEL